MEELTVTSLIIRAALVIVLVAANGFFVAAEFALVAARRTRIESMVRKGDRKAKTVQAAHQDLYRQLSAAQLGITLASILLGYVAEETIAVVLHGWLDALPPTLQFLSRGAVASIVAVSIITFLHVVIGEQAPKAWAITHAERTARWIAAPLIFFSWITRPVTNVLNWSANGIIRLLGIKGSSQELETIHSPDEIVMMLKRTAKSGHLDDEDVEMIEGVFEFTEKVARDVMTPRTELVALSADLTVGDALDPIARAGRSRYPVYQGTTDNVVGIVHVKEILGALSTGRDDRLTEISHSPFFVPGTREVEDVLADMKRLKHHMAVVLDEYGGTAGLVTMEDLLEEIVGEIYDEYDETEPLPRSGADETVLPGDTEIEDVNSRYGLEISDASNLTIGGYVFGRLGRLPSVGDVVHDEAAGFEVIEMDGRRVGRVRMTKKRPMSDIEDPTSAQEG
jgi:CBS domain containing-hemolysin-like protein